MQKKTYIVTSGKHHVTNEDGTTRIYKQGDRIELTKEEAEGLTNKVRLPDSFTSDSYSEDTTTLKQRIAELEAENAELKEAIDEE